MRKFPTIAVLVAVLVLAAAVAVELTQGTWFEADPLDRLGALRENSSIIPAGPLYGGGADFVYRRDRWGFRGNHGDPARITVLTVGGAFTEQHYLADEATWQGIMRRELQSRGRDVEIANAGLEGMGTQRELEAFGNWFPLVPNLRPRFVILSVGANDEAAELSPDAALMRPLTRREQVRRHSALWRLLAPGLDSRVAERVRLVDVPVDFTSARWIDLSDHPGIHPLGASPMVEGPSGAQISAFQDRLHRLAAAIHDMGAVPVFVTQVRGDIRLTPDGKVLGMVQDGGPSALEQYRRLAAYNKATRQVCADEGLLCLDLAGELTFEQGDFYDYLHVSPAGAGRIGRWLAAKLAGLV